MCGTHRKAKDHFVGCLLWQRLGSLEIGLSRKV